MGENPSPGDGSLVARSPTESLAVLTTTVLPADTNAYGNLFGGHLVSLIDKTASITASRHARSNVVTASIDRVDFIEPIRLGDILTVESRLNYVGTTSMEIGVEVSTEHRISGGNARACSALLTFVAMDADGRPCRIPPVAIENETQRRTWEAARARAEARRASRRRDGD